MFTGNDLAGFMVTGVIMTFLAGGVVATVLIFLGRWLMAHLSIGWH